MVTTIVLKHGSKSAPFYLKMNPAWHHGVVHALLNTHLPSFDSPIAMKKNGPHRKHLLGVAAIVLNFQDDRPENSRKQPKSGHFSTVNRP